MIIVVKHSFIEHFIIEVGKLDQRRGTVQLRRKRNRAICFYKWESPPKLGTVGRYVLSIPYFSSSGYADGYLGYKGVICMTLPTVLK